MTMRAVAAMSVLACVGAARADDFVFSYSSDLAAAHGVLSGVSNGNGTCSILSGVLIVDSGAASGTYNLVAHSGTSPFYSNSGFFIVNNQLRTATTGQSLDIYGLLFSGNNTEINIWGNGAGQGYTFYSHNSVNMRTNGEFTFSAVPAPATLTAIGFGTIFLRRKRR